MNLEAVIFDMDGVLVDSEPLWKQAEIACFAEYGVQLTVELCHTMAGMRLDHVIAHWARKYPALQGKEAPLLETQNLQEVNGLLSGKGKQLLTTCNLQNCSQLR